MTDTADPARLRSLSARARRLAETIEPRDGTHGRLIDYARGLEDQASRIEALAAVFTPAPHRACRYCD